MPDTKAVMSVGELLIDLIVTTPGADLETAETFAIRPGGAPANVSVALARLGVTSAFCGVVGDDPFGRRLIKTLRQNGVETRAVRTTKQAETTVAYAWKDARGDGHFRLLRMADLLLAPADLDAANRMKLDALVVGSVAMAGEPSRSAVLHGVRLAADGGVPVCLDINLRPTLWENLELARALCAEVIQRATLVKLSLDDARHLAIGGFDPTPETVLDLEQEIWNERRAGPPIVILTDGARGTWTRGSRAANPLHHVPAFAVQAVEPTGAGDAFTAGIIKRLLASSWVEPSLADLRYAAAAGALTTTRPGAIEALPTADELDRFLADHASSP